MILNLLGDDQEQKNNQYDQPDRKGYFDSAREKNEVDIGQTQPKGDPVENSRDYPTKESNDFDELDARLV